jgi:hypothetical protein
MTGKYFQKILSGLLAVSWPPVGDGVVKNRSYQIKQLMAGAIILDRHSV